MKSFVGLFVNVVSVSDLTVLRSWFLNGGNVVFFSDMIHLMTSTLVFFPLLGQCLRFDVCGVWVIVMYCLVRSFWLSCILCLDSCIRGLFVCLSIDLLMNFQYFKVRKQTIFVIILTWSASLWCIALSLPNSVQITIVLFLFHFCKVAPKITE